MPSDAASPTRPAYDPGPLDAGWKDEFWIALVGTLQPVVLRAINEVTGRHYRRIESFNDHPDTDHGQVVEVLARARDDLIAGRLATLRSKPAAPVGWRARLTSWANRFRG